MQKNIKFQKRVCFLLSLLLILSSLATFQVFAEAEAAPTDEPTPAPVSESELEPAETVTVEEPEVENEAASSENIVSDDEIKTDEVDTSEENTESATETESVQENKVADNENEISMNDSKTAGNVEADSDNTQSGITEPEYEKIETPIMMSSMFAIEPIDLGPISIEGNTLVLQTVAANYLQAHLVFSDNPTKDFVLEVKSPTDCRFLCNWTEIYDSRISIEVTPPMDDFIATIWIPFDFLEENGISLNKEDGITFNNQRYNLEDFDLPGTSAKEDVPEILPPYTGITIDGNFDDWASIAKTDLRNPNTSWPCTMQSAVVWDGDYVYIYFHVDDGNASAIGAMGTHSNGQFAITTDLGNIRLIQPDFGYNSVEIFGIDDAKVAVDNYNWDPQNGHSTEIVIPTSILPAYKDSISFGYYQVEPFLKNIMNLHPAQKEVEESSDFACDGVFGEWAYYPHTLIEYDTAGQQESKVDGGAALHVKDGILYGHVKTAHRDHLDEIGGEFLAAIEIAFNGDLAYKDLPEKGNFYPKMVTTDGNTTVNEGTGNTTGITTYLISDIRETTPEPGPFFGTMKIKVDGTVDEMEFAIDLKQVAEYIGVEAPDFKTIHARFGRIGDEWVETAGTPTGTGLGLALCFSTVGGVYVIDKKKKK